MSLLTPQEADLRRAKEHHRDRWMWDQVKALHERGAALERAAGSAVPGAARYPDAVPGYWPEITR